MFTPSFSFYYFSIHFILLFFVEKGKYLTFLWNVKVIRAFFFVSLCLGIFIAFVTIFIFIDVMTPGCLLLGVKEIFNKKLNFISRNVKIYIKKNVIKDGQHVADINLLEDKNKFLLVGNENVR